MAPSFWTPRSDMQRCSASSTTPTPFGSSSVWSQSATCVVAAEQLDDPAELAQADDAFAREVGDVGHPVEREQVVHAERVERNRSSHDQLVVALVVRKGGRSEGVWREQLGIGVGHPPGRVVERRGIDVGTNRPEQIARRPLQGGVIDAC